MKKIVLFFALLGICNMYANAQTAFTIDASGFSSGSTIGVVLYAVDAGTSAVVGVTSPITVTSATGVDNIDITEIPWEGEAPAEDGWLWSHADVTIGCALPYTGSTNSCGSIYYNGITVGYDDTGFPRESCFEIISATCIDNGTSVGVDMGNDGQNVKTFPGKLYIY